MKVKEFTVLQDFIDALKEELKKAESIHFYDEDRRRNYKKKVDEVKPYKGAGRIYKNLCAFDIETTAFEDIEQSLIYSWQFAFLTTINEIYYYRGTTYDEFCGFARALDSFAKFKLIIYVHNLSYEFGFIYPLTIQKENLIISSRHVLKSQIGQHLELRCSYLLTGKSLDRLCRDMNVEHKKLSGEEYNYSVKRYPDTPLTAEEEEYQRNDVVGLIEALVVYQAKGRYKKLHDMPYTKTGVVRQAMRQNKRRYKGEIAGLFPQDKDLYEALCFAFRGGNTHRNREKVGYIIDNVQFYDRKSAYPRELLKSRVPMTPLVEIPPERVDLSNPDRAYLLLIWAPSRVVRDDVYTPFLSISKCQISAPVIEDNGRIMRRDKPLKTWVTDIDYKIIKKQYIRQWRILKAYRADYDFLPYYFRQTVFEFYQKKSDLKGVKGREFEYMQAKEAVNSCYGFCREKPLKDELIFDVKTGETSIKPYEFEVKKNNLTMLQWGVWVTRWARYHLQELIDAVGGAFVYCDTDSVAVDKDCADIVGRINQKIKRYNLQTYDGRALDIGIFEPDKKCAGFITWGRKKYAYTDEEDKVHVTISGVNKEKGRQEVEAAGGLPRVALGFEFKEAGGTAAKYNRGGFWVTSPKGNKYYIAQNVYIFNVPYTLGITQNYSYLIKGAYHELLLQAIQEALKLENL